jgi:hypothetical protein
MCLVAPPDAYIIPKYCHLFPIFFPGPYFFLPGVIFCRANACSLRKKRATQIQVDESEMIYHR